MTAGFLDLEQRYRDHHGYQASLVSEGAAADEFRTIRCSDYQGFALGQRTLGAADVVIF